MRFFKRVVIGMAMFALGTAAFADDKPYKEGPVVTISYIKIKPGKFDEYMKFLAASYKPLMEARKQAGFILDWRIYAAEARNPHEPDVILTETYVNMAGLDPNPADEALGDKMMGGRAAANQGFADRSTMREVLGNQIIRQMILK